MVGGGRCFDDSHNNIYYGNFTPATKMLGRLPKFYARSATFGPAGLKAVTLGPFFRFQKHENHACDTENIYYVIYHFYIFLCFMI